MPTYHDPQLDATFKQHYEANAVIMENEPLSCCGYCGSVIDYCQGHGEDERKEFGFDYDSDEYEARREIFEREVTAALHRSKNGPERQRFRCSPDPQRRRKVTEQALEELNPDALFMDGLDSAIVGWGCQYSKNTVVVYEEDDILWHLMENEGMTYEEAWEHYSFNIAGAWVGENTPIIIKNVNNWVDSEWEDGVDVAVKPK